MQRSNRRKIIVLPSNYVLDVFSNGISKHEYIRTYAPLGLPNTATPERVYVDYERNAICMVVSDASFDEVPDGCMCPIVQCEWLTVIHNTKTGKTRRKKI